MNRPPLTGSCRPGYVSVGRASIGDSTSIRMGHNPGSKLQFPATHAVLWDHRPTGPPITISLLHYRNPVVVVEEKTMRLVHRFCQDVSSDAYSCHLIGSVTVDADGCGVSVTVDRLNTGQHSREDHLSQLCHEEISIPCVVRKNGAKPTSCTEDYEHAVSLLSERCTSKSRIDLCQFISLRANCSYHGNAQTFIFHIDFDLVAPMTGFRATPVNSVPIVPSALSKNLGGPMSMSDLQGEPKTGYLTMDHTRKSLLILESDPKVNTLPIIGIWISGVSNIHDPFVWASSLRYIFNNSLQQRMCVAPQPFLIILYSPLHSRPECYECVPTSTTQEIDYTLCAAHEVIQLPKDCLGRGECPLELEMANVEHGERRNQFDAALQLTKSIRCHSPSKQANSSMNSHLSGSCEDITPRMKPAPLQTRTPTVKPSVPEVSILFDEQSAIVPKPAQNPGTYNAHPTLHQSAPVSVPRSRPPQGHTGYRPAPQPIPHPVPQQGQHSRTIHPPQPSPGGDPPAAMGFHTQNPAYQRGGMYSEPSRPPVPHTYPSHTPEPQGAMNGSYIANPSQMQVPYHTGQYSDNNIYSPGPTQGQYPQGHIPHHQDSTQLVPPPRSAPPRGRPPQGYPPSRHITPASGPSPSHLHNGFPQPSPRHPSGLLSGPRQQTTPRQTVASQLQVRLQSGVPHHPPMPSPTAQPHYDIPSQNGAPAEKLAHHYAPHQMYVQPNPPAPFSSSSQLPPQHSSVSTAGAVVQTPLASQGVPQTHLNHKVETSPIHNSTDSGLHSNDSADSGGHLDQSTASVYSQVPVEVYERLRAQDEQLQTLRNQLAQLLANQSLDSSSASSKHTVKDIEAHTIATQSSFPTTPAKSKPQEKCTVAINTSLFWPSDNSTMENTRVQEALNTTNIVQSADLNGSTGRQASCHAGVQAHRTQRVNKHELHQTKVPHSPHNPDRPRTTGHNPPGEDYPSPIQDDRLDAAGVTLGNETLSLGEFQLTQIQDRTETSLMSEMMVDMPAFTSLSPEKGSSSGYGDTDESNRSPVLGESVSMYEQQGYLGPQEQESQDSELLMNNQKEFYGNLIGNVQKLLAKHNTSEGDTIVGNDTSLDIQGDRCASLDPGTSYPGQLPGLQESQEPDKSINVAELTLKRLREMGVDLDQSQSSDTSRYNGDQSCFLDPALLPKISYMSMMFDSGESDLSHDADALAMKYLSDEQLSVLARQRRSSPRKSKRDPALNMVMSASHKPDLSTYGPNSNHMSFASRKYLERYGLAEEEKNKQREEQSAKQVNHHVKETKPTETLGQHPALNNVQEYLRRLNERSFSDTSTAELSYQDRHQHKFHHSNSSYRCDNANQPYADAQVTYHSEESYLTSGQPGYNHTRAPIHNCGSSDITSDRIPADQDGYHHRNVGAPARTTKAHVGHSPGQMGDYRHRGAVKAAPSQPQRNYDDDSSEQSVPSRVLDIERLKQLPKLL